MLLKRYKRWILFCPNIKNVQDSGCWYMRKISTESVGLEGLNRGLDRPSIDLQNRNQTGGWICIEKSSEAILCVHVSEILFEPCRRFFCSVTLPIRRWYRLAHTTRQRRKNPTHNAYRIQTTDVAMSLVARETKKCHCIDCVAGVTTVR